MFLAAATRFGDRSQVIDQCHVWRKSIVPIPVVGTRNERRPIASHPVRVKIGFLRGCIDTDDRFFMEGKEAGHRSSFTPGPDYGIIESWPNVSVLVYPNRSVPLQLKSTS